MHHDNTLTKYGLNIRCIYPGINYPNVIPNTNERVKIKDLFQQFKLKYELNKPYVCIFCRMDLIMVTMIT